MTPVEEMALAETMEIAGTQAGAGVEKAVCDVDGPDDEGQKHGHPKRATKRVRRWARRSWRGAKGAKAPARR